jgi:gluconokinase
MDYFIGVDIGTTSTKTVAFSAEADILASRSVGYSIQHPQADRSEQDPNEIFEAVITGIRSVITARPGDHPVLVSFSAAMHSLIAVDRLGKPLTACIIWADNRASAIADRIHEEGMASSWYEDSGVPVHAMSPLCKLIWLRENQPALFKATDRFIGIKEFIFHRLFGVYVVDTSVASATGLLDIRQLQWHSPLLDYAGLLKEQLPALVAPSAQFQLPVDSPFLRGVLSVLSDTKFIIGGSDGGLANLGSGATGKNNMAVSIGTSSAARIVADKPYLDPQMRTFCYHLNKDSYIIGGAGNNGAVLLQWLRESLLKTDTGIGALLSEAATVAPGAEGVRVLPYVLGERAPIWDAHAKAAFIGFDVRHNRAHLVRAAMEAIVYSVYGTGRILTEQAKITHIHATGGFTQTPAWVQILADVFNCRVLVSDAVEASALGAVMVGLDALGLPAFQTSLSTKEYLPDESAHSIYLQGFEKMEKLYRLLQNEM